MPGAHTPAPGTLFPFIPFPAEDDAGSASLCTSAAPILIPEETASPAKPSTKRTSHGVEGAAMEFLP